MRLRMTIPVDWRRPESAESYQLFWDDKSEYGMLYPRPSIESVASFYKVDDYYTHHVRDLRKTASVFDNMFGRVLGRVSWQLDQSVYIGPTWFAAHYGESPVSILDLGCGGGQLLAELKEKGHTVVGVEPDNDARKIAEERGVTVYAGTAEQLPDEVVGQKFDAIFITHVLEHCVDPVAALKNSADLLAQNGKVTIEVPNHQALGFQKAGLTWRWLDVPRHLNFFTPKSLQAACREAGLEPVGIEYRGYTRQFDANWIRDEQKIYDRYKAKLNGESHILPERKSQWQAWKLFSQTIFVEDAKKYDSVRVIAAKR